MMSFSRKSATRNQVMNANYLNPFGYYAMRCEAMLVYSVLVRRSVVVSTAEHKL